MTGDTLVATHSVLRALSPSGARAALGALLDERPDLVALQEWNLTRLGLLRRTGSVALVPGPCLRRRGAWLWVGSLWRDCVLGARADRFTLLEARSVRLGGPERCDHPARPGGFEPPRYAVLAVLADRLLGDTVALVGFHLAPGVQTPGGAYRDDRPLLVARHRREVARLQRLADEQRAEGRRVLVAGDSNFDGLRLDGLESAWSAQRRFPGVAPTFGTGSAGRRIDDVFGTGEVTGLDTLETGSDHRALLVRRT